MELLLYITVYCFWILWETFHNENGLFKRLAYTLIAYCYGSKSVTQPDASSKRYLWDKISC